LVTDRGASDTYIAQASAYLKKPAPSPPPYDVAAEYICSELAHQLRLPVPPSFVAELPGEEATPAFTCLAFNLAGGRTPEIDPVQAIAAEPDLCTGVLVFDIWIVNIDRHTRNISFQALRTPHRLNVFDHSHALFFYPDGWSYFANRLGITGEPGRGNRHCLLDVLDSAMYIPKWVERISKVPNYVIKEIFSDAVELGLPANLASDGARFFIDRRDRLASLIAAHRAEFSAVTDWPLI
jgi:hypothetical protein